MRQFITAGMAVLIVACHVTCHSSKGISGVPMGKKQLLRWTQSAGLVQSADAAHSATATSAATTLVATDAVFAANATQAVSLQQDLLGRIVRVDKAGETDVFSFHADSVLFTEYMNSEQRIVYLFKGRLDATGKLTSGQALVGYSSHITDTVLHQFVYDEEGHLVIEYRNYGVGKVYAIRYTYELGDVVKIETWYNDELFNTKLLEYDRRYRNYTGLEEGKFRNNMNRLTGNASRHLVKGVTSTGRHGKLNYSLTYEYEMDEEGMVLKQISKKGKKVNGVTSYYYTAGA